MWSLMGFAVLRAGLLPAWGVISMVLVFPVGISMVVVNVEAFNHPSLRGAWQVDLDWSLFWIVGMSWIAAGLAASAAQRVREPCAQAV
jgi:hypothetical protein